MSTTTTNTPLLSRSNSHSSSGNVAETQRDIYLEQQSYKQTTHSPFYHICHPRTHFTLIAFLLLNIVVLFFGVALVSSWSKLPNVLVSYTHNTSSTNILQYSSWLMPLVLCIFTFIHICATLGIVHTSLFLTIAVLGSYGMNVLLGIQFHNRSQIMYLSHVKDAPTNMSTFPITQTIILYVSHCIADTIIYGRISKHRMMESVGRRLFNVQLVVFLPLFSGLLAFTIDEIILAPLLFNSGIISFSSILNNGNGNNNGGIYFGMSVWYLLISAALHIAIIALYLLIEVLLDSILVVFDRKILQRDPDRVNIGANLVYAFFRPVYAVYRLEGVSEWIGQLVGFGRFVFNYVFIWIVWLCFGIMVSTVIEPFILRIIGLIVFGGTLIASLSSVLISQKTLPDDDDANGYHTVN